MWRSAQFFGHTEATSLIELSFHSVIMLSEEERVCTTLLRAGALELTTAVLYGMRSTFRYPSRFKSYNTVRGT